MKKWMKKAVAVVLTTAMTLSVGIPAFAAEKSEASEKILNTVIIDVQEEAIPDVQITRAGDTEYKRELVETKTFTKKYIGVAGNQPSGGTVFNSAGGFYWSDGGNIINVSFALSAGPVSIGISAGKSGSSGTYISAPVNTACKLHVYKDVTVRKYALYKKTVGSSTWTLDSYDYGAETTRNHLEVRAV